MKEAYFDTETDRALWTWLGVLAKEDAEITPSIKIEGDRVIMHAHTMELAFNAATYFPKNIKYGYSIFVGGVLRFTTPTKKNKDMKPMLPQKTMTLRSSWARSNAKWLEYETTRNTVSVYSTNSTNNYQCLDMFAYLGLNNGAEGKRILAIDAELQRGKPIILDARLVPEVKPDALQRAQIIGNYKKALIERAIASQDIERFDYSMTWAPPNGTSRVWHKQLVAIPVNPDECVILTKSLDAAQDGYWQAVSDSIFNN